MTIQPWQAEIVVDVEDARALIRAQAPGVAAERVERLGEGRDDIVHRVDEARIVRFPRRAIAADVMIAFSFLPARARLAFHNAYGPIDDRTWRLARSRALHRTATVAVHAHETRDRRLLHECRGAFERILEEP
jgi:hypothetical protein